MPFLLNAQFTVNLESIDLGNVERNESIEFEIIIEQIYDGLHTYYVSIFGHETYAPWLNIDPSIFSIQYWNQPQTVTFTGTIPNDWDIGEHSFVIDIEDVNDPNQFASVWVNYNVLPPGGVEDYISIDQYTNSFSENDELLYSAYFYDLPPLGDYITEWNLLMTLSSSQGDYTYMDLTGPGSPGWAEWQFFAPNLPENMLFSRNELGQVNGILTISGLDNDFIIHKDEITFGINKEPDIPNLYHRQMSVNSINLIFTSRTFLI